MEKYTPGPWKITEQMDSFTIHTNEINIAEVLAIGGEGLAEIGEANATLIAAAPELLKTLTELVEDVLSYSGGSDPFTLEDAQALVKEAKQAIAKATGK